MSGITDKPQIVDSVLATIETEPTDPIFPCPECGSETKLHGEATIEKSEQRICSSALCRKIQPKIKETLKQVNNRIVKFPCRDCGCETKIYKNGKINKVTSRICSNKNCRNII